MNATAGANLLVFSGLAFLNTHTTDRPALVPKADLTIRLVPEDILLEPSARPQASLSGEIEVVEDLGADQILHMLVGAQRIIVRTPQGQTVKADGELTVHFPLDRLHLFVNDHLVDWAGPAHASE